VIHADMDGVLWKFAENFARVCNMKGIAHALHAFTRLCLDQA
jgi:hypothetical protein